MFLLAPHQNSCATNWGSRQKRVVEGNFTRVAAPAESIHNDLLYILLIWKSLKLNYMVAQVVIYCGGWLAKLVVQKEEFFGFIGF